MSPEQQWGTPVMGWDKSWLLDGTPIIPVHTPQADLCIGHIALIQEGKLYSFILGHFRKTVKLTLFSECSDLPPFGSWFCKAETPSNRLSLSGNQPPSPKCWGSGLGTSCHSSACGQKWLQDKGPLGFHTHPSWPRSCHASSCTFGVVMCTSGGDPALHFAALHALRWETRGGPVPSSPLTVSRHSELAVGFRPTQWGLDSCEYWTGDRVPGASVDMPCTGPSQPFRQSPGHCWTYWACCRGLPCLIWVHCVHWHFFLANRSWWFRWHPRTNTIKTE